MEQKDFEKIVELIFENELLDEEGMHQFLTLSNFFNQTFFIPID